MAEPIETNVKEEEIIKMNDFRFLKLSAKASGPILRRLRQEGDPAKPKTTV